MSVLKGKDYIYLIWKDPITRRQFIVGQLLKNGQFEFSYGFEVNEAIKNGFKLLVSFDDNDLKKVYKSDVLFPAFASRLPDKKRSDIDIILSKYGLHDFNEYELLKKSGAKLPIDNLSFIDPILSTEESLINREFYLAGTRYYIGCDGVDCTKSISVNPNAQLILEHESNNLHDKNAIKVLTQNKIHLGYIPRYYSNPIIELLNKGYLYTCNILDFNKENKCNECIKVSFKMIKV